jgi:hypothetical protein
MAYGNEYAAALGSFYDSTPKAVFAALAFSLAAHGETADPKEIVARLTREWQILYENGVIRQAAPKLLAE